LDKTKRVTKTELSHSHTLLQSSAAIVIHREKARRLLIELFNGKTRSSQREKKGEKETNSTKSAEDRESERMRMRRIVNMTAIPGTSNGTGAGSTHVH
jgi:hypothetical protein